MRAIVIEEFGGPEVLRLREGVPEPEPTGDLVRVRVDAAGVNYADTHQAENSYLAPQQLPLIPGAEVVGRTDDGRRVVALVAAGGYAEVALAAPATVFDLPDGVEDGAALAVVLQGTTAWHLLRTSARLQDGETVVVHAAAGGVGSLAVQLAKASGAGRVIATASSGTKRDIATALGADATVAIEACPDADAVNAALRDANGGRPVDVVLEMTGGHVFSGSLAALAPFGRLVVFGMASREAPPPLAPGELMLGSRAVVGFWLKHCLTRPGMLPKAMADLLARLQAGTLRTVVGGRYPLSEVARAHQDLRTRRTTGKLVLDVRS